MIQKFIAYLHETFIVKPCTYEIHENVEHVHSIYVDVDNDVNLGRVTLWDDGSCVMEILDIETEQCLLFKRYEFASFDELVKKFDYFYSVLSQTVIHEKPNEITNKQPNAKNN